MRPSPPTNHTISFLEPFVHLVIHTPFLWLMEVVQVGSGPHACHSDPTARALRSYLSVPRPQTRKAPRLDGLLCGEDVRHVLGLERDRQ